MLLKTRYSISYWYFSLYFSFSLTDGDYKQLVGNIEDIIAAHNKLSSALVEQEQRTPREQRIGGAFLTLAPHLQGAHHIYCSNHPRAVCILEKYK